MTTFARGLYGVLPAWRPLRRRSLPLWSFIGAHSRMLRLDALGAELRCARCRSLAYCRRRAAAGALRPPRHCPNAKLFGMKRDLP